MDFVDTRTGSKLGSPGPFIGIITNNLDPTFMGRLEVGLIKGLQPDTTDQSNTYIVKYLSPFYGVTSDKYQGANSDKFDDVQKSYGMWMVPPDIGTRVLVIFIDGDPNQGYWIGCVMDQFQNHMVPGIAASDTVFVSSVKLPGSVGVDFRPSICCTRGRRLACLGGYTVSQSEHPSHLGVLVVPSSLWLVEDARRHFPRKASAKSIYDGRLPRRIYSIGHSKFDHCAVGVAPYVE